MALFLVDGTFEIFRCFRAADSARNDKGDEVGASRAFFHTMASLLRQETLTHIAIAFDSVVSRVSRSDRSDSALLRNQFPICADIARAFGMTIWPMSRFQADDALATGAARFGLGDGADTSADGDADRIDKVVLCSNDNDFAQCIRSDYVVRLNRIRNETWNEESVRERFGVGPKQIPEYFALVGDPSDGIPGIPGFGPKAASALIDCYGSIEKIPKSSEEWQMKIRGAAKLSQVLEERRREALLYRNLSIRRTDVPLPDSLEDLRWLGADRAKVESVVESLGDPALLDRTIRYRPMS